MSKSVKRSTLAPAAESKIKASSQRASVMRRATKASQDDNLQKLIIREVDRSRLFEKAGFVEVGQTGTRRHVMQLKLTGTQRQ